MSTIADPELLPVVRAVDLADMPPSYRWLIDSLWARQGVGILGGAPKCCKSWLALDIALSVASNTPCLGRFRVVDPGSVLLYMAEDAADIVKHRLACLARHRGIDLADCHIDVITAPSVRLDLARDCVRLARTIGRYRPRMLVLDPFVRLHRIHENDAGEVSAVLAYLRELQRAHELAILVVHHARKNGVNGASAGQGLRGSGDFFAWADSLIYLQRNRDGIRLTVEHRAAAAHDPLTLHLDADDPLQIHLRVRDAATIEAAPVDAASPTSAHDHLVTAVLVALQDAPLARLQIRAAVRVRNERLGPVLDELVAARAIIRNSDRWARAPIPVPSSP